MALKGNLRDMNLSDVIQTACKSRNQACLLVQSQDRQTQDTQASIFFADGNVVHAVLGSQVGEEVVYELLTWEDGEFELEMDIPSPPERTITVGWSGLLLEGMRRIDERVAGWEGLDILEEQQEVNEMAKLDDLLKEMASDIPGFVAATVSGMDGLGIASHSVVPEFDIEGGSAQFTLVMKLVQKATSQLGNDKVEDNLVTTNNSYLLTRFLGDGSYWLGLAVGKEAASLGNVRLMARDYADDLWKAIPRRRK